MKIEVNRKRSEYIDRITSERKEKERKKDGKKTKEWIDKITSAGNRGKDWSDKNKGGKKRKIKIQKWKVY